MRIAIVSEGYFPEISGVTVSLHQRLKYFSQWGHSVRVYAPDYSQIANIYPRYRDYLGEVLPGVTVVPFPSQKFYVDYTLDPKAFSARIVEKDIEAFGPDVIHLECAERLFMGFFGRVGVSLAKRKKIATSAIYHTNYLDYLEDFKKQIVLVRVPGVVGVVRHVFAWVYNSYDVTMVPSPTMQNYLIRWGFKNTLVDHFNGVDIDTFKPSATGRQDEKITILYVGRFTVDKQIGTLLRALTLAAEGRDNLRFILVGDGPERENVSRWAEDHPGALLPGRVPFDQVSRYYQMADIFVTASTRENRPLSIQEAMSCGLAVVAPAKGGIVDQIKHGETGWLVKPDDPQDLAEAVSNLLDHPELRLKLGKAARKEVENFHTWEYSARAMIKIWENLRTASGS